jgi:hypothetical protein
MLTRTSKGLVIVLGLAGALGGTSAAVATVSHRVSTPSTAPAPARRRPRVEEGCRELPVILVAPPSPASCS